MIKTLPWRGASYWLSRTVSGVPGPFAFSGLGGPSQDQDQRQRQRARAPALHDLVQEVLAIQRVSLGGAEAGVADYAAQFLFGSAVGYARGSYYILFQHHRAYVVAAEAEAHLADF